MSRIVLILVIALVAVATLFVAIPSAFANPPYAPETTIQVALGTQDAPQLGVWHFWESVWEDDAAGDWNSFVYGDPTDTVVPGDAADQRHPAIFGRWVVYEDDRAGNWDIYAYDRDQPLSSPSPTPVASPLSTSTADQLDPAIDGLKVVFEDKTRGDWDISYANISTGAFSRLTASRADQVDPAIDGDGVVYADHRNGNWDIYYFSLKTHRERRLTTSKADQTAPQIDGATVVYQDHRNGNWDIYSCSLTTGRERRLTTDPLNQTAPQINRGASPRRLVVVYQDDRNGAADIYCYDALSGSSKPLTDDPAAQTSPSMYGEAVVWCDERGADPDIYGTALEYPTLSLYNPGGGTPRYNATVTLRGNLESHLVPIDQARVLVSGAGKTRTAVVSDPTASGVGLYSLTIRNVVRKVTVRALYKGGTQNLPAAGNVVTIKPRALLSRPVASQVKKPTAPGMIPTLTVDNPRSWVISGTLKPRHRAGTQAVRLRCYKYSLSGTTFGYYLKKTVSVKVSNIGAYSGYRTTLKLPDGKWKIQAVHADADHAETISAFSKVLYFGRFWVN